MSDGVCILKGKVFRRIGCAVLIAVMIFSCCPGLSGISVSAADKSFDRDGYVYTITDTEKLTVEIKKAPEEAENGYVIPSTVTHRKKNYTVTGIANAAYAFTGIEEAVIPETVTSIGNSAFAGCSGLRSVFIPAGLESVGTGAFSYCNELTAIEIDPENRVFSFTAGMLFCSTGNESRELVWGSPAVKAVCKVPEGTVKILPYAFEGNNVITDVKLPSTLTGIGSGAFMDCALLKNITVPKSVKNIGDNPFMYCPSLETVKVAKGNRSYTSTDTGLLLNAKKTVLISASAAKGDVILPESIKRISKAAAAGNTGIVSVSIGKKVKTVEAFAFADCSSLSKVIFAGRKTVLADDGDVFKNSYYYLDVTVPYPSGTGTTGSFEDMIRRNSPNGVIIIWR